MSLPKLFKGLILLFSVQANTSGNHARNDLVTSWNSTESDYLQGVDLNCLAHNLKLPLA